MRGKRVKELRKITANPSLPYVEYQGIEHEVLLTKPTMVDNELKHEAYVGKRIQVIMKNCQRKLLKKWKNRYNKFARTSYTLPHRGLNQKEM